MEETYKMKLLLSITAAISFIIYYFSNLIAKLLTSNKIQLEQYFLYIQKRMQEDCNKTVTDEERDRYFFFTDVVFSG